MQSFLKTEKLSKIYQNEGQSSIGLQDINLDFNIGEFVAITGESGSGKSTLLKVLSLQESYEEGELFINGTSTIDFKDEDFTSFQSKYISFIFQDYKLIESFTVLDNVMLPLLARGISNKEAKLKALQWLDKVKLYSNRNQRCSKLSGGQKQRVAIARALVCDTPIIACDEPTGNLDETTTKDIIELFKENVKNKLVLYVTHDYESIKDLCTRHIIIKDGHVKNDINTKKYSQESLQINNNDLNKKSRTKNILLAFKELIKTPNKTFISSLVGLVLSTVTLFSCIGLDFLCDQIAVSSENSINKYYDTTIINDGAMQVYKTDNVGSKIETISTNDIFFDNANLFTDIELFRSHGLNDCTQLINNGLVNDDFKLVCGEQPLNDNEIGIRLSSMMCLSLFGNSSYTQVSDKINTYFINKKIQVTNPYSNDIKNYTIKGVYDYKDLQDEYGDLGILFCNSSARSMYKELKDNCSSVTQASDNYAFYLNSYKVRFSLDPFYDEKITVNSLYKDEILSLSYNGVSFEIPKEYIIYADTTKPDDTILLSYGELINIIEKEGFFFTCFANDVSSINELKTSYIEKGYTVHIMSTPSRTNINATFIFEIILFLIPAIMIFMGILLSCSLIGVIYSVIYKTKERDYSILISLSYKYKDVKNINFFELLIQNIVCASFLYFCINILFIIIYNTGTLDVQTFAFHMLSILQKPMMAIVYFALHILFAFIISKIILRKQNKLNKALNIVNEESLL